MAIDYSAFCELLRRCAAAWDLPDIGLRMIRYQQVDFLGPVALVTRMERTVRGALQAIIANLVIHANATVAVLEEAGETASLILNQRDDALKGRENTELVLAQGKLVIDFIAGAPTPLVEAAFVHETGNSARAVAAHFGCPIRYGAERNALSFDRALLTGQSSAAILPITRSSSGTLRQRAPNSRAASQRTCAPRSPGRWSSATARSRALRRIRGRRHAASSGACMPRG